MMFIQIIKSIIIIIYIFIVIKNKLKKDLRVGLCVIGKNENLYAREFVEHYKKIGYDNIILYDNNDNNDKDDKFEDVINDYIKDGFVRIIDFKERNGNERPLFVAYKDCYSKYNSEYDWLSFFDMDEFLELNEKYKNIKEFLNDKIFTICQAIKINWLFYINDNILYYENKTLRERMKKITYDDLHSKHIKSTVRGNLYRNYWENIVNSHTSNLNYTSCSSSGKIVESNSPFIYPPDYTNAKLKHYYYKSFEEFCVKIKRGMISLPKNNSNQIINKRYEELIRHNKNNSEKLKIIHMIFNDNKYNILNKTYKIFDKYR